jgi:hypothetical protein
MSKSEPAEVSSNDSLASAPAIEAERYERGVREEMSVEHEADRLYRVANGDGETYTADLATGACECPDAEYRGDEYVCKHVVRAALIAVYQHRKARSELGARTIEYANEHGCEASGCNGPFLASDDGLLPCPTCCDAVRSEGVDEFDVWQVTRR